MDTEKDTLDSCVEKMRRSSAIPSTEGVEFYILSNRISAMGSVKEGDFLVQLYKVEDEKVSREIDNCVKSLESLHPGQSYVYIQGAGIDNPSGLTGASIFPLI